jgi:hydroxypyruvate isomerase
MVEFAVNASMITDEGATVVEAVDRAADLGVPALEFFDWEGADLSAVRERAAERGVDIAGTLAAGAVGNIDDHDAQAATDPTDHETAVADLERSLRAAGEVGADVLIVLAGPIQGGYSRATQRRALQRVLRAGASVAEEEGVTMVVEPLNRKVDHPGYFLETSRAAFDIVRAVESDRVQVLYDVYHQQITEGDLIRTLTENLGDVGHVHISDNPGRHEPGTGEIDYATLLSVLDDAGYDGRVGMEWFEASEDRTMTETVERTLELS